MALHPVTSVLRRQRIEDTDSQRRGEIETEAEMRMMRLQAKEHLKPLEAKFLLKSQPPSLKSQEAAALKDK